ncbi:MAG: prepilin-type N-terminal cleavage/methylation domain-containing protein [Phycisphaerae bacterium]|jgi:prepilin-type N-terminal cleavage/methylation domain-containing protein
MKIKKQQLGITLVELIIVIAIIVIMAAAVYVVRKPAEDKGKIELTKSTIELLCGAIEQYNKFYNEFPDPNDVDNIPNYFSTDCDSEAADPNKAERLSYRLSLCPDAVAILNQINPKMVKNKNNADDILEYIDAWGMEFRYEYTKPEKWNFPRITSAGPDGKFNTADDITSKK